MQAVKAQPLVLMQLSTAPMYAAVIAVPAPGTALCLMPAGIELKALNLKHVHAATHTAHHCHQPWDSPPSVLGLACEHARLLPWSYYVAMLCIGAAGHPRHLLLLWPAGG